METTYVIQSTFEVLALILLVIGYFNEEKLAIFERKLVKKAAEYFKSKKEKQNSTLAISNFEL